jgi:transketolase N-terminal domain/subunit
MTMEKRAIDIDEVRRLMARATGDEKHDESSTSTLDALAVLYGRILHVDQSNPK